MRTSIPTLPATLPDALLARLRDVSVLLVDEERYFRETIARMLRHVNISRVVQASTLAEARRILAKRPVSLVICEHRLPDGSGLDLVRHLRGGDESLRTLPFLLLSGELDRTLLRKAVDHGVDDCMVKPLRPITLYQRIARLVHSPPVYVDIPGVYFGPDRRRRTDGMETIEDRRKSDAVAVRSAGGIILEDGQDAPDEPEAQEA